MRSVVWTRTAILDVERIEAYVAKFDEAAARRLTIRLRSAGDSLANHAERGRRHDETRRVLVIVKPYLIFYRITDQTVAILHVRHGARRPLKLLSSQTSGS